MSTLEAIRSKFTNEPVNLTPAARKSLNAVLTERRDLAKLQARGLMAEPSPSPYGAEERALRERVRETSAARLKAAGEQAAAYREHHQAQLAHNSFLTKIINPDAIRRAEHRLAVALQHLEFADGEERAARSAYNTYKRQQADRRLASAHAQICQQDRVRAEQRRAQGIPPVPRGEVFVLPADAFRKV